MSDEALKRALDVLISYRKVVKKYGYAFEKGDEAITAIQEALAQPEQEPVAYLCENAVGHKYFRWKKPSSEYKPVALYTTPQKRPWVGLTDAEWSNLYEAHHDKYNLPKQGSPDGMDYERAIEAKLKERNHD
jgi:hypothetical protein